MKIIRKKKAEKEIKKIEKEMADNTAVMKQLRAKAESLSVSIDDPLLNKALHELSDEFRFADPVSSDATKDYDERLDTLLESIAHHEDSAEREE